MALLTDIIVNANKDARQDNRSWTTSNSSAITYSPIIAFESSVLGNSADSSASAKTSSEQTKQDGITGGNIQNILIAGAVVGGVVLLASAFFKK